jgi:AcrR family transcriptional regulator
MNFTQEMAPIKSNGFRHPATLRAPSRRKRDRPARQEALIRAAKKLFATRGYEATTTREIAAAAGCAEGLIHRYFNGKAGLLFALMNFYAAQGVNGLSHESPPGNSIEEEIQQLMGWEVERMWKDRELLRVSVPRAILDPKVGKFVSQIGPQRHAVAISERIRRHRECGTLKTAEIEALSHAICSLGFIFGFIRPAVLGYDRTQAKKIAIDVARMLSRGIRASATIEKGSL